MAQQKSNSVQNAGRKNPKDVTTAFTDEEIEAIWGFAEDNDMTFDQAINHLAKRSAIRLLRRIT